jgi:hypothetical protein
MVEHHEEPHLFLASTLQRIWHKKPTCSWLALLSEYCTKSLSRPESGLDFSHHQPRGVLWGWAFSDERETPVVAVGVVQHHQDPHQFQDLGFGVWDLGCEVWSLEFGVWGLGFGV